MDKSHLISLKSWEELKEYAAVGFEYETEFSRTCLDPVSDDTLTLMKDLRNFIGTLQDLTKYNLIMSTIFAYTGARYFIFRDYSYPVSGAVQAFFMAEALGRVLLPIESIISGLNAPENVFQIIGHRPEEDPNFSMQALEVSAREFKKMLPSTTTAHILDFMELHTCMRPDLKAKIIKTLNKIFSRGLILDTTPPVPGATLH